MGAEGSNQIAFLSLKLSSSPTIIAGGHHSRDQRREREIRASSDSSLVVMAIFLMVNVFI